MAKPVCAVVGIGPGNGEAFARTFDAHGYALALLSRSTDLSGRLVGATASLRGIPKTAGFAPAKAAQRILAQSMAKHLQPHGIHVSVLIIDGVVGEPDSAETRDAQRLDPRHIAEAAYYLTQQPPSAWSFEMDLRPMQESW